MKIFLDENFPLRFYQTLKDAGYDCEHVITVSKRGDTDREIAEYLASEQYVFFTHDDDFENLLSGGETVLIISKLPQGQLLAERIRKWKKALEEFLNSHKSSEATIYEILPDGTLEPKQSE